VAMLSATCNECDQTFPLREVKLDPHWKRPGFDPVYAYCPNCGHELDGVDYRSVDFARSMTPRNALIALVWFSLFGIGVLTDTLVTVGPIMVAAFGFWLALRSNSRDHKIIGWILVAIAGGVYVLSKFLTT